MITQKLESRSTSLSSAISTYKSDATDPETASSKQLQYEVANSYSKRVDATGLAYEVYLKKGYTYKSNNPFLINHWDYLKTTLCINVTNNGKCIGSLSLVKDNDTIGLPMDALYHDELNQLRNSSSRLLEATRYVIEPSARNQKEIILTLMQYMFIHAFELSDVTDIVIEVNPSHVKFYENALLYEVIGEEKKCGLVNNAPAVLMKVSRKRYLKAIETENKNDIVFGRKQRRLMFSQFKKGLQKQKMLIYLERNRSSLSKSDSIKLHNLHLMSPHQNAS